MNYIAGTLNHFRAVRDWAIRCGADISLDVTNFELHVGFSGRAHVLWPRFLAEIDGRLAHTRSLVDTATGVIGWVPYRDVPVLQEFGDKAECKEILARYGLHVPAMWKSVSAASSGFLIKPRRGSFGYGIRGPFRTGSQLDDPDPARFITEEFVKGTILKFWYWGDQFLYAHAFAFPSVTGDGSKTIEHLITDRFVSSGVTKIKQDDAAAIQASLAFQERRMGEVLPPGQSCWFDYRYGRTYSPRRPMAKSDSALDVLPRLTKEQAACAGKVLDQLISERLGMQIIYTADGVCDEAGRVWWLEVNTNPIVPPDAYPTILDALFSRESADA